MNVIIIEDEYLLADELEEKLNAVGRGIKVLAKLESIAQSIDWLSVNTCDLIFLDVHLSDGLSFSIFDSIDINIPIIFTTAYNQYAIKAFDLNSIAYLLKPIDEKALLKALDKYEALKSEHRDNIDKLLSYIGNKRAEEKKYRERFVLTMGKVQKPVSADEIAYFMADDKYLFAFTFSGEKFFCDSTLTRLEEELNPKDFFRVNRSYFVNIKSVNELIPYSKSRTKVRLKPETEDDVITSSAKTKEFKEWLVR